MTSRPFLRIQRRCGFMFRTFCVSVLFAPLACTSVGPPASAPTPQAGATLDNAPRPHTDADNWRYALVIDASSSASALQIYQWRPRAAGRLPQIEAAPFPRSSSEDPWETKVKPGLGDLGSHPEQAARSLAPLIEFALEKLGNDPERLARASLHLRATAGMRLLPEPEQDEILASVRSYFASLSFGETSARVISGEEEGIYGWIAVNYILGHLEHGGAFPTVGALDLGGASTQITYVPLDHPQLHGQAVTIGTNTYYLYAHSYLGLGQDQARSRVGAPACFITGYPIPGGGIGTGDFKGCRKAIRETFSQPCPDGPCSLFGAYQPPLYGDFLAFSVYGYAADFFDLGQQLVPATMADKGAAFCAQNWNEMINRDPGIAENPYLPTYCYAAAHITTLLTDGFGFPSTSDRITAPLRVQGTNVGWALGALVYEFAGGAD